MLSLSNWISVRDREMFTLLQLGIHKCNGDGFSVQHGRDTTISIYFLGRYLLPFVEENRLFLNIISLGMHK